MTQQESSSKRDHEIDTTTRLSNSLDSLRHAGCKLVNKYLPSYQPDADSEEVFGVTQRQFERAVDIEWIRRGRPENNVVAALYHENDRLKEEFAKIGLMIDAAVHRRQRSDEPASLTRRLDMVRSIATELEIHQVIDLKLSDDGSEFVA